MLQTNWSEEDWDTLVYTIRMGKCILMLGPGVSGYFESGRFISFNKAIRKELLKNLNKQSNKESLANIALNFCIEKGKSDLERLVSVFYEKKKDSVTPYHEKISKLPFSMIVNASPDTLLYKAMLLEGKFPSLEHYNFQGKSKNLVSDYSVSSPLIYNLFGIFNEPESLVLTEDDLIDFLRNIILKDPPLPSNVLSELRHEKKSLLFLGFGFKDWYLRILLRVLQGRKKESRSFALEPGEAHWSENFESTVFFYSKSRFRIQIYKLKIDEFLDELCVRLEMTRNPIINEIEKPMVFISYAEDNADFANEFAKSLLTHGVKTWHDKRNLELGDEWDKAIQRAIKKADYFILLQSKDLKKRLQGYVNKEIKSAIQKSLEYRYPLKFILPVSIDEGDTLDDFKNYQTIKIKSPRDVENIIRTINRDQERRKKLPIGET